jgi:hypothetical protein
MWRTLASQTEDNVKFREVAGEFPEVAREFREVAGEFPEVAREFREIAGEVPGGCA